MNSEGGAPFHALPRDPSPQKDGRKPVRVGVAVKLPASATGPGQQPWMLFLDERAPTGIALAAAKGGELYDLVAFPR